MASYGEGTDISIYDNWLKEWYINYFSDALHGTTNTWQELRQDVVSWTGKYMVIPLRTRRNASDQFIDRATTDGGGPTALSVPGYQGVSQVLATPYLYTSSVQLTQDGIDQAKGDRGAFVDLVDTEMMMKLRDAKEFLDKNCYSDGTGHNPGFMSNNATAKPTPGTNQVASILKAPAEGSNDIYVAAPGNYFVGKRIQVFAPDYSEEYSNQGSFSGVCVVKSVTDNGDGTGIITVVASYDVSATAVEPADEGSAGGTDWAVGAHIHDYGSLKWASGPTYSGRGMQGFYAMNASYNPLGSSAYMNINRDTAGNEWWRAYVDTTDGSGQNAYNWASSTYGNPAYVIQKMIDQIHENSNGEINKIFMSRWGTRVAMALTAGGSDSAPFSRQRFVNTTKTQMGFMGKKQDKHPNMKDWIYYDGTIPLIVDKYCAPWCATGASGKTYQPVVFCDTSSQYIGMITDINWWTPSGSVFLPVTGAAGANYAFGVIANLYMLANFVCDNCNRNGLATRVYLGTNSIT